MHSHRRNSLRDSLTGDWALFLDQISVNYLSGFTGSNGLLVVGPSENDDLLVTDSRYQERVKSLESDMSVQISSNLFDVLKKHLPAKVNLVVDPKNISLAENLLIEEFIDQVELKVKNNLLDEFRMIKDAAEIELISKACEITSQSLWYLINDLRPGMTERQIAKLFWQNALDRGADDLAFETIVASGANGASPHHEPTGRALARGDMVTIDCGVKLAGYNSDMTRTVFIGSTNSWQEEIYQLTMQAQQHAIAKAQIGASAGSIDLAAREVISDGGFGQYFVHGTGHGVGLAVHEAPFITKGNNIELKENYCFTVEPGIYLPGQGGVRIEDTCILTVEGLQILTRGSHEIVCVG
jgi:Xaa-Pro aminopeptidase